MKKRLTPNLPAPTRAQLDEQDRRTLEGIYTGWKVTPGTPWTATKDGETLTADYAAGLHDMLNARTRRRT